MIHLKIIDSKTGEIFHVCAYASLPPKKHQKEVIEAIVEHTRREYVKRGYTVLDDSQLNIFQ